MVSVVKRLGLGGDLVLLAIGLGGFLMSPYYVFLFTSVAITALICLSVGVTTERAGVISLCQVAFAGVGGWTNTWLLHLFPESAWAVPVGLLLAGLVPALMSLVLVLPTLRVRGVHLAIVTLAFALVVNLVLTRINFPGFDEGFSYLRSGWLESDPALLMLCVLLVVAISRALVWMEQRPVGAAWFGVKFSERALAAFGVSVAGAKLKALAVGAFVAGVAGGLLELQLGSLSARNFEPMSSLVIFALAVLSGSRFLSGALVAALLTWFVPELLTAIGLGEWKDMGDLLFAAGALHALHGRMRSHAAARQGDALATSDELPSLAVPDKALPAELTLDQLTVSYGATKAVSEVCVSIRRGSVTGLVGPNGAGKSSLVDAITGFTAASGRVLLDGRDYSSLPPAARALGAMRRTFQVGRAIPELTIRQYVGLASGRPPQEQVLDGLLRWLGCPAADTLIAQLDVGTRRLIELAAALASRPRLLLLDEPAAGMSAHESERLGKVIQAIPHVFGCTVLLIEHDLPLIRKVCSDLLVLEFGKVIANGPVSETLALPHVVEAYIGA